jgi:hypothetical protein
MSMTEELPKPVVDLILGGVVAEFATLSSAGVPIDTACLYFPSEGLRSIDLATGLGYPIKAERARKYPKVGLLIEGARDEPVISIGGMAAIRDSDFEANAVRYLSETGYSIPGDPPWSLAQKAVWYWTRIIVEITPARVLWWDNRAVMDSAPHRWDAPAGTIYPASDPSPPGGMSASANWPAKPWQEVADHAMSRRAPGHLSLVDPDGFPLPIRARNIALTSDGFAMEMPKGVPWSGEGKASLSFEGLETFIGEAVLDRGATRFRVDRVLPFHPLMNDRREMWAPTAETHDKFMARLKHETERRGVGIPKIPAELPAPTEGAKLRMARGLARKRAQEEATADGSRTMANS